MVFAFSSGLDGKICLQTEEHGEAWYIDPVSRQRYYLGRPADAFRLMKNFSLGISDKDLARLFGEIPSGGKKVYQAKDEEMAARLSGRIMLRVQSKGEAYYINPDNLAGYYLGSPDDAFRIMQSLGLGISNKDLQQIKSAEQDAIPPSTEASPAEEKKTAESEKQIEEKIPTEKLSYDPVVFLLNEEYADRLPDWKEKAQLLIKQVNTVFSKTTAKEFKIIDYAIYDDKNYSDLLNNLGRYPDAYNKLENKDGIIIVSLVYKKGLSKDELKELYGISDINTAARAAYVNKKKYNLITLGNLEENSIYGKPSSLHISITAHELGHLYGLGLPEWYFFSYSDCTGVSPKFPDYSIFNDPDLKNDPMVGSPFKIEDIKFSELNSAIINRDPTFGSKLDLYSSIAKVHVIDKNGQPVPGAVVKIYNVRKTCCAHCDVNCLNVKYGAGVLSTSTPDQILTTDKNGYAAYRGPFAGRDNETYLAKAIKVYYKDKSAVKTVNFIDLQKSYILNGAKEHITEIILD